MFIQVIQGTTADPDGLAEAVRRWHAEIAPQVTGWLGTTSGTTADGRAIAVVRFESPEAAQRSSELPAQQQWWERTRGYFTGDATFHDCTQTFTFLDGGTDDAGFVQIIQGRVGDTERMRQMLTQAGEELRRARPDVLGGTVAVHPDGGFTQVVYFSSEAAARAGEQNEAGREPTPMDEEMGAMFADATYYDLTSPHLLSPA